MSDTGPDQIPHLLTHEFRNSVANWLEMMAAAYAQATNIPPEQCQLVVFADPERHCMIYRIERRPDCEAGEMQNTLTRFDT